MPARTWSRRPAWKKPTKYHAVKTLVGDVLCDSMAEARRWRVLQAMEATGLITRLRPHPAFPLVVNGQKIGVYIADAEYSTRDGRRVVEDVKGCKVGAAYTMFRLNASSAEASFNLRVEQGGSVALSKLQCSKRRSSY